MIRFNATPNFLSKAPFFILIVCSVWSTILEVDGLFLFSFLSSVRYITTFDGAETAGASALRPIPGSPSWSTICISDSYSGCRLVFTMYTLSDRTSKFVSAGCGINCASGSRSSKQADFERITFPQFRLINDDFSVKLLRTVLASLPRWISNSVKFSVAF